ncbi:hypothetical protein BDA96_09G018600 [Sorghum bicolor]|nr:hypothetical protein BDA96_09G018600 [Sorghum bicolor]
MPNYILSFLSRCPIPNDYIAKHFGCLQSLLSHVSLSYRAFLCSTLLSGHGRVLVLCIEGEIMLIKGKISKQLLS